MLCCSLRCCSMLYFSMLRFSVYFCWCYAWLFPASLFFTAPCFAVPCHHISRCFILSYSMLCFCSIYTAPCLCSLLQASLVYTSPPHSSLLNLCSSMICCPMLCGFTYDWPIIHCCMIRCFMSRFYILCCASCLTAPCFMLHFSVFYVASCVCRSMHAASCCMQIHF